MADLYDATDMVDPDMVSPKATWKPGWGDAEFQEQRAVVRKLKLRNEFPVDGLWMVVIHNPNFYCLLFWLL